MSEEFNLVDGRYKSVKFNENNQPIRVDYIQDVFPEAVNVPFGSDKELEWAESHSEYLDDDDYPEDDEFNGNQTVSWYWTVIGPNGEVITKYELATWDFDEGKI